MTQVNKNLDEHKLDWYTVAVQDNAEAHGRVHGHELDVVQQAEYEDDEDGDGPQGRIPIVEAMVEGGCSKYHYVDYYDGQEGLQRKITYGGYVNDGMQQRVKKADRLVIVHVDGELRNDVDNYSMSIVDDQNDCERHQNDFVAENKYRLGG